MAITRWEDFTHEELELARLLSPHLTIAHTNTHQLARLRERRMAGVPDPGELMQFGLTPREAEVSHWLIHGKRDAEIAVILGSSPRTVQKHVANILVKLGVEGRTAAASELIRRWMAQQGTGE